MTLHMVFDVESVGLHGDAFAVGYVVVDEDGKEIEFGLQACDPSFCRGTRTDHAWVVKNVPDIAGDGDPAELRSWFWEAWRRWSFQAVLWADCGWPVETRFLALCVDDAPLERTWTAPYPVHEIATAALLSGANPIVEHERLPGELPAHNPLHDARQSARLLLGYLKQIKERGA